MIPYPYNMVDMGGIDLAEANGTVVDGLYAKIVEAVNACGDVVLYNWKFAGIEIAPQHTSILLGDPIIINGAVQVTEQDEVTVPGINPDPKILVPIEITENGQYDPSDYNADGFSEVGVDVEYVPPTLVSLSVDSNGIYLPSQYDADGFSEVSVDVSSGSSDVEYWNLSDSFIGTLRGIVSTADSVTIQNTGASFGLGSALRFGIGWDGMTIEIETGDLQLSAGTHRRFVMIGSSNSGVGFIYRLTGKWAFYNNYWEDSAETDGSFFDNCLVKIHIDSTGHWHIYKDGILFWEPSIVLRANYSYLVIGSTSGGIVGSIKNVRVY